MGCAEARLVDRRDLTDGKSQVTRYTYDSLDRLKTITYNDNSLITFNYDANGNLTSRVEGTQTTSYAYDALNRVTTETKPDNTTINYGYDNGSRLTSITENSRTTSYGYDNADRLITVQEPGVPAAIGIAYADELHSTISYPGDASVASTYDSAGRLTQIVDKNASGATVASYSYTYTYTDGTGTHDGALRQTLTDASGNSTSYGYDGVGRLLSATTTGPNAATYSYTYDLNGNMTSKTVNGVTTTYTVNAANEVTNSGYAFDANGNQTSSPSLSSLAYNPREQTTSITPSGQTALSATYSGPGQTERTGFAGDTFLNDSLGIGRRTSGSTITDFTRDAGGTELSETVAGNRYYFAFDGLGSVVGLFDSAGNLVSGYLARYEPYGKLVNATPNGYPSFPLRFAGYWYDSQTGLYKVGLRYYDPDSGRWTQRDPIDNPLELHGWNRYIYAGDDPVNLTDPSGALHCPRWLCKKARHAVFRKAEILPYGVYHTAYWARHHTGHAGFVFAPFEYVGIKGDMAADWAEGNPTCDENPHTTVRYLWRRWRTYGCYRGKVQY